jgi:hypothetical protein
VSIEITIKIKGCTHDEMIENWSDELDADEARYAADSELAVLINDGREHLPNGWRYDSTREVFAGPYTMTVDNFEDIVNAIMSFQIAAVDKVVAWVEDGTIAAECAEDKAAYAG